MQEENKAPEIAEETAKDMHPNIKAHVFKKGCTPWNKGKKMPPKEKQPKDSTAAEDDRNTVKIKIAPEVPKENPKDFSINSEAFKERVYTKFINSVMHNRPEQIEIGYRKYYSEERTDRLVEKFKKFINISNETLDGFEKKVSDLKKEVAEKQKHIDELQKDKDSILDLLDSCNRELETSHRRFRSFVIGALLGLAITIGGLLALMISKETKVPASEAAPHSVQVEQNM